MTFNINKASLQRTFESVLKAIRAPSVPPVGINLPDTDMIPSKAKAKQALLKAIYRAEGEAYGEATRAQSEGKDRIETYKSAFEQRLQTIAAEHGVTFKPAGTTLRA